MRRMTEKLTWLRLYGTDPYRNLAVEEYLTSCAEMGELLLILWQNQKSVVIGRNQNCFEECRSELLEAEGGKLVRRRSGGGAVYHDLGNLNFSFITGKETYDLERQLRVIVNAVRSLGIKAEVSGRNDILAEGRKISGSAFLESEGKCCHHGTLMISVEKEMLERYLRVSGDKLSSKGIKSVGSRVANLSEWNPDITVTRAEEDLRRSFGQVYGGVPERFPEERLDEEKIAVLTDRFSSGGWIYGRKISFNCRMKKRFHWGFVEILMEVDGGRIAKAEVYSDAMAQEAICRLRERLPGCPYRIRDLSAAVEASQFEYRAELAAFIAEQIRS